MPTDPVIDLDALLAPISEEAPAGRDIRYEGPYDQIKSRMQESDTLEKGVWDTGDQGGPDWRGVVSVADEVLRQQSKDLTVASWMTKALVRLHGFAGLRDGLLLLGGLLDRYWEGLFPLIEDDDLDFRAAPLLWLDDHMSVAVRQAPVTSPSDGEPLTTVHWEESRRVDNLGRQDPAAKQKAVAEGKIDGEAFDRSERSTSGQFYETAFADLKACRKAYDDLDRIVEQRFGSDAPSLRKLREGVDACLELVEKIHSRRFPAAAAGGEEGAVGAAVEGGAVEQQANPGGAPAGVAGGPIQTRDQAFRQLAQIATFMRRTEPLSPVAYLLDRAVRWGSMSFVEVLEEFVPQPDARRQIWQMLGIKNDDGNKSPSNPGT